jgi:hypothetical protein
MTTLTFCVRLSFYDYERLVETMALLLAFTDLTGDYLLFYVSPADLKF